jgi:hypothetical protein
MLYDGKLRANGAELRQDHVLLNRQRVEALNHGVAQTLVQVSVSLKLIEESRNLLEQIEKRMRSPPG